MITFIKKNWIVIVLILVVLFLVKDKVPTLTTSLPMMAPEYATQDNGYASLSSAKL